ncbi:hypothetical protein [Hymenobacter sp. DG01]|uniref:hypothetical protein n=1 Tax=Hymenobacter sp. DG01 TaxID=2584940 RepID=UPI001121D338|nr:hypothetical protein [Hymenobacter sp. DG01]
MLSLTSLSGAQAQTITPVSAAPAATPAPVVALATVPAEAPTMVSARAVAPTAYSQSSSPKKEVAKKKSSKTVWILIGVGAALTILRILTAS